MAPWSSPACSLPPCLLRWPAWSAHPRSSRPCATTSCSRTFTGSVRALARTTNLGGATCLPLSFPWLAAPSAN
uniref:Uncharacterized protein n=1 Tax=Ixodes ricinus TaxID=34613 RepID=A0A6B0UAA9_IXORI